jgi:hemerythrin-like domain-containing protein
MNTYRVKPVVKNIIIQNMDVHQIELVRKAMETTGKGAASKAIFQILSEHQRLRRDVFNMEKELALFNGCNKESKKVIGNKE